MLHKRYKTLFKPFFFLFTKKGVRFELHTHEKVLCLCLKGVNEGKKVCCTQNKDTKKRGKMDQVIILF